MLPKTVVLVLLDRPTYERNPQRASGLHLVPTGRKFPDRQARHRHPLRTSRAANPGGPLR